MSRSVYKDMSDPQSKPDLQGKSFCNAKSDSLTGSEPTASMCNGCKRWPIMNTQGLCHVCKLRCSATKTTIAKYLGHTGPLPSIAQDGAQFIVYEQTPRPSSQIVTPNWFVIGINVIRMDEPGIIEYMNQRWS
jgi:hypothetical protein